MNKLYLVLFFLLLGGYNQGVMAAKLSDQCEAHGFEKGTQLYLDCLIMLENNRRQKVEQLSKDIKAIADTESTYQVTQPPRLGGDSINCTSTRTGNQTHTNCKETPRLRFPAPVQ